MKARTIKNMMSLTTLVGACGLLLLCSEAWAQSTCTVDRLTDTGEGQELRGDLRFCIEQARSGRADTIGFDVIGVITLTGTLSVPSVAIVGPGPRLLAVQQGASSGRIFDVGSGARVSISGLTITGGSSVEAGGIANLGSLTLSDCLVSGNRTVFGGTRGGGILNASGADLTVEYSTVSGNSVGPAFGAVGGGIYNEGTLTVFSSTISGNQVQSYDELGFAGGGGIYNAAYFGGIATVTNSTISGNSASGTPPAGSGGGISGDAVVIRNSTVAGNRADRGAGGISGRPDIRNTIVAGNNGGDLSGVPVASGFNLFGTGQAFEETDIVGDPLLGPLQDNGGPTLTHALLVGSPAIDAGDNTGAPDFDQRGDGFPRIVNDIIDIGAYEAQGEAALAQAFTAGGHRTTILRQQTPPTLAPGTVR